MSKQGGVHVWEEDLKVRPGECSWETELRGGGDEIGKGGLAQKESGSAIFVSI